MALIAFETEQFVTPLSNFHFSSGDAIRRRADVIRRRGGPSWAVSSNVRVPVSVDPSSLVLSSPTSVLMSRCLALARFALGSSLRTGSRPLSSGRGLSSGTIPRSLTVGKPCL